MLFSSFAIPVSLQRRVLVYGVVGAIVMRTAMIFAGAWLIAQFHWILYLFGAFLVVTGVKMWWFAGAAPDIERNPLVRWLRAHVPITHALHGERFFVRVPVAGAGTGAAVAAPAGAGMPAAASRAAAGTRGTAGRLLLHATPLFLVLVLVEVTDLIFAVDSIPAVFAITTDPFIVLTSNVFAILGLRAMYFLLADMADRFTLLKYGLAIVLVLIGTKMLLIDLVHIPVWLSLGCVATIIATSVMLSLSRNRGAGRAVEAVVPARR
jgi:tellurite resistance protein TerC